MESEIKAVVFRTSKLKATKEFFTSVLGFSIKESSITHFVIYSKKIRILFIESDNDFEVELYISNELKHPIADKVVGQFNPIISELISCEDPNNIKIIVLNHLDFKYKSKDFQLPHSVKDKEYKKEKT